jgi:hypothetical protein
MPLCRGGDGHTRTFPLKGALHTSPCFAFNLNIKGRGRVSSWIKPVKGTGKGKPGWYEHVDGTLKEYALPQEAPPKVRAAAARQEADLLMEGLISMGPHWRLLTPLATSGLAPS